MAGPEISVLMPVWNGCQEGNEQFLTMAIESILYQTFEDWELVIVDDGSTDATPGVLAEYARAEPRIRIIRQDPNQGIVVALNKGISECRADLVARQDADDMSTVTRLEIQKEFLQKRPETAMCGTGMYVITEEGKLAMHVCDRPCRYSVLREALKEGCMFVHGSVMFRRQVVLELGGYSPDPRFQHAEDYEFWVRMAKDHVVENIPGATLYFHRNHSSKISSVHSAQQLAATELIMQIARDTL